MGVRGLTSYLENYCPSASYSVDIKDLVLRYKAESTDPPVFVIDGMSVLRPLVGESSWLNGGQMKEIRETLETFIHKFTDMQCKVVIYFDGPLQEEKITTWKARRNQSAQEINMVFQELEAGTSLRELDSRSHIILPNGCGNLILSVIDGLSACEYFTAIKECDMEIADYAFRNKCFAIISNDSDFIILNAAKYYLSIKHFNLEHMTTLCYDSLALAQHFGLEYDQLPLLASLVGNDILGWQLLKPFHSYLNYTYPGQKYDGSFTYVFKVARFIRSLAEPYNLSHISQCVFKTDRYTGLLKTSIDSYNINKFDILAAKRAVLTSDINWNKVIEHLFSEPKFGIFYDIILNLRFTSSVCMEDYRPGANIIPCGKVLGNLRKFWYGILLDEKKPCFVRELVFTGCNDLDYVNVKPYFLTSKHPGLLALWTDKSDAMRAIKLRMLEEIFQIESTKLMELPLRLAIPALTLKYLRNERMVIQEWELAALIATTVCVQCYSIQKLKELPDNLVCKRSILLYTTVSRGFTLVRNILLSMKDIFLPPQISVDKFTDGKLFHHLFRKFHNNDSFSVSFCEEKECLELFGSMRSFLGNT